MKMMKLIYPLAFALAVTLAATGCQTTNPSASRRLPGQSPMSAKSANPDPRCRHASRSIRTRMQSGGGATADSG